MIRWFGSLFYSKEFPELKTKDSISEKIGGKFWKVLKKFVMLCHSGHTTTFFDFNELWCMGRENKKIYRKAGGLKDEKLDYIVELKIDGLKVVLTYDDGKFVLGATRGDGEVGEDITENLKVVRNIPNEVLDKRNFVAVGEAWMKKSDLHKINKEREKKNLPLYANPRNLAAGTLRQLDTGMVAKRNLQTFVYDIEFPNIAFDRKIKTHAEELEFLAKQGFNVNKEFKLCKSVEDIEKFISRGQKREREYGY